MSIEQNKAVARKYYECLLRRDVDGLEELFAENFTWIVPVKAKALAHLAFPRDKQQAVDRIRTIFSGMSRDPEFKIISMTAEEDRVHVESDGVMYWSTGQVMENLFHHAFVMRDGKIEKCTEYTDFLAIQESDPMVGKEHFEESQS